MCHSEDPMHHLSQIWRFWLLGLSHLSWADPPLSTLILAILQNKVLGHLSYIKGYDINIVIVSYFKCHISYLVNFDTIRVYTFLSINFVTPHPTSPTPNVHANKTKEQVRTDYLGWSLENLECWGLHPRSHLVADFHFLPLLHHLKALILNNMNRAVSKVF